MCGIFGFVTNERHKNAHDRRKMFVQGMIAGQLRGDDATGVFYARHVGANIRAKAGWVKNAIPSTYMMMHKDMEVVLNSMSDLKYVVGHNRYGTYGSKHKVDNAHPFQEGNITLVHNGSLTSTWDLPTKRSDLSLDVEVDSHVIAHNLNNHSVEDVVARLIGAYALVWHDVRDDSLNVIRNEQRPLVFAKDKTDETIYFASEAEMLAWIALRNNVELTEYLQPKPGRWLKFLANNAMKPEVRDIPMYKYVAQSRPSHPYANWNGGRARDGQGYEYDYSTDADEAELAKPSRMGATGTGPFAQGAQSIRQTTITTPPSNSGLTGEGIRKERAIAGVLVPSDKRIKLNKQTIKRLHSHKIHEDDTYLFHPINTSGVSYSGAFWGKVSGLLDSNMEACIYGIGVADYTANKDKNWIVRPITVYHSTDKLNKAKTEVVCTLMAWEAPADYTFTRVFAEEDDSATSSRDARTEELKDALAKESSKSTDTKTTPDDEPTSPYLKGPKGILVNVREWFLLTDGGCSRCNVQLTPDMHEHIVWLNKTPVCYACVLDEHNQEVERNAKKPCRVH